MMKSELYRMILNQLEILMPNFDLTQNLFLIKKDGELIGYELANKDEPITAKSNELVEYGSILELYLEVRDNLGFKQKSSMLRAIRIANNLTQTDVGNIVGKTRFEISRWENKFNPPQEIIDILINSL